MAEDSRVLGVQDLRMEFPGIYAWNSFSSPSQLSTELLADGAAVQFAIALLAQEHLQGWDCLQSPPTDGRVYSHVTKLKVLLQVSMFRIRMNQHYKRPPGKQTAFQSED